MCVCVCVGAHDSLLEAAEYKFHCATVNSFYCAMTVNVIQIVLSYNL